MSTSPESRWRSEAEFFDAQARRNEHAIRPLDPAVVTRYSEASLETARYPLEYAFALAGNLSNLSVLDVGCGEGANSALLAKLGARVTGVDISPGAIDIARRRAKVNSVSDQVAFTVSPLETIENWADKFDLIWCEAFLHHVLGDLESIVHRLVSWLSPNGRIIILEPIALSGALRAIRRVVPLKIEATPDERPLVRRELRLIQQVVPSSQTRYFRCLGRLARFTLPDGSYEHAPAARKKLTDILAAVDDGLFRVPTLTRFASIAVVSGNRENAP